MKKRIYLSENVIIDVFKLLNEHKDIKKTEIAKKLQISRNTVHNAIKELKIKGWIVQNAEIHIIHKISEKNDKL